LSFKLEVHFYPENKEEFSSETLENTPLSTAITHEITVFHKITEKFKSYTFYIPQLFLKEF